MGSRDRMSVAAVFLGIATFSKPTLILLVVPLLLLFVCGGSGDARWWRARSSPMALAGLFAWNVAITGEWNYQGGDRRTFYGTRVAAPGFPSRTSGSDVRQPSGEGRATNRVPRGSA